MGDSGFEKPARTPKNAKEPLDMVLGGVFLNKPMPACRLGVSKTKICGGLSQEKRDDNNPFAREMKVARIPGPIINPHPTARGIRSAMG